MNDSIGYISLELKALLWLVCIGLCRDVCYTQLHRK